MRLHCAIFDLDGTLLDSLQAWTQIATEIIETRGGRAPSAETLTQGMLPLSVPQMAAWFHRDFLPDCPEKELERAILDGVKDFYSNRVEAKPGVKNFLTLLKMEGVQMYVATATQRPLVQAALAHTGLDGFFRGIITSDEVGKSKNQSPDIYEWAMRRMQSNKRDTVIFEDALFAVRTVKQAGFRVAAVYDPSAQANQQELKTIADYYIESFEELYQTNSADKV